MISLRVLADTLAVSTRTVEPFYVHLQMLMPHYEIDNPLRQAAFLAQVAHESGRFIYTEEIASGKAYEGRADLGNTRPGDGVRFKGRGLIQLTGRANYAEFSAHCGIDFIENPALLSTPQYAVHSACWFWSERGLNALADVGEFKKITKIINGGYNGLEQRTAFYMDLCEAYGLE